MIEYPKIETLFDRDPKTHKVDPQAVRLREFSLIREWRLTEKVDGTNIRVHLSEEDAVTIGGRTDSTQVPPKLFSRLYEHFTPALMAGLRIGEEPVTITLFGEGHGAGIQKGGIYSETQEFALFDVLVADRWWLGVEAVREIGEKVGVPVVPYLGVFLGLEDVVEFVRSRPATQLSLQGGPAEGIVSRTDPLLYDNQGQRIMYKLKWKDF